MKHRLLITGCILLAVMSVLAGCERIDSVLHPNRCSLCGRPIREGMGALIEVDDRERPDKVCCLQCAITYGRQTGSSVRVLSVTDYASHEQIRPDHALYVVGSKARPCCGPLVDVPAGRREAHVRSWDRCLPAVIAFADREEAERVREKAGGTTLTFAQVTHGTSVTAKE